MAQTLRKYGARFNRVLCEFCEFYGLSTDTKPIEVWNEPNTSSTIYIDNGSIFYEIDTNTEFRYSKENQTWCAV